MEILKRVSRVMLKLCQSKIRRLSYRYLMYALILFMIACGGTSSDDPDTGQRGDTSYIPEVINPAYETGSGPRILIDEAHNNYHTASGRYRIFAEMLRRDGYVVEPSTTLFTTEYLEGVDVMVISNAVSEDNMEDWSLPNHEAFTPSEIAALEAWVDAGGSLMLIADHMPMPGAAEELAAAFGVLFHDGFAYDGEGNGRMVFSRNEGNLADHPVTRGRDETEQVPFVTTFTGQAFRLLPGITNVPLMTLPNDAYMLLPVEAWEFSDETPRIPAGGLLQGALLHHGEGRLAVFGEAAMFSAQVQGKEARPMGMNHPEAPHNAQFLLNVMHWLTLLQHETVVI